MTWMPFGYLMLFSMIFKVIMFKLYVKFFFNVNKYMWWGFYSIIPIPYFATQSLLPFPHKPQLYISPKNLHIHTIINETPTLFTIRSIIMEHTLISITLFQINWWLFYFYRSIIYIFEYEIISFSFHAIIKGPNFVSQCWLIL